MIFFNVIDENKAELIRQEQGVLTRLNPGWFNTGHRVLKVLSTSHLVSEAAMCEFWGQGRPSCVVM